MIKESLLKLIEDNLEIIEMSFDDDLWRSVIPSDPGWYFIETNTPPDIFKSVGPPKGERHYNIPEKIKASLSLKEYGLCILPINNSFYFVYSGEAKNLKARAREHMSGHSKTGCLALKNYPVFKEYIWRFHFTSCHYGDNPQDSKLLRIFLEQMWRAKYGWPILCGK